MSFNQQITVGGTAGVECVEMGAGLPVLIQTMWKDRLGPEDAGGGAAKKILARIDGLKSLGCRLLRFAVPDIESAETLGRLAAQTSMPLVADIHFDYRIALRCLDFPVAKIRINPGNIGAKDRVEQVLHKCAGKNVPVRIGVNAGSLSADLRKAVDGGSLTRSEALVQSAERELAVFDGLRFYNVIVSMKASSAAGTIAANKLFASRHAVPLHIGVTEAGPLIAGVVRNTAALYELLREGIGDTVRVSLSDSMENEVIAAREILFAVDDFYTVSGQADGKRRSSLPGVKIISCPRCGRCAFDTHAFTRRWQTELYKLEKNISVAIMGCPVNGPGEARGADLGITGTDTSTLIFKKGEIIRRVDAADADEAFREELGKLTGFF
jgi:(E)-4-hydroxy-3-methylbut-2-enyl-diphosphate synthase